jgi:hypothetical protein
MMRIDVAARLRGARGRVRALFLLAIVGALTTGPVAGTAMAQVVARTVNVNCGLGQKINAALRRQIAGQGLIVNITDVCTENVSIITDGVILRAAAPGAGIHAADPTGNAVFIDGGRRIELEGLAISGGARGVVAYRGASVEIDTCTIQGASINGISSSYGATTFVDNSTVRNNGSDGVLAANQGTVVVTNSTISNNGGSGVTAVRNSHARVGQNFNSTAFGPVTVRDNASNGITITDASAGIVNQTTSRNNSANGIFVGRSSYGEIGGTVVGGVTGTNTIDLNHNSGIHVEGAHAIILGATLTSNTLRGISFFNGASGRIGIRSNDSAYVANTITGNGGSGIEISDGASALIGGNTISGNGTSASGNRFGIGVFGGAAQLAGSNLIENHPQTGLFVSRGGNVFVGARHGSLAFTNTIRNNGIGPNAGGSFGGIFAFQNGVADVRDATIDQNHGFGILSFKGSNISMRNITITGSTAEPATDTFNTGRGVIAAFNAIVRFRENITISGNAGDGIGIFSGSSAEFRNDGIGTKQVINNGVFGVACFGTQVAFSNPANATLLPNPSGGASNCSGWE